MPPPLPDCIDGTTWNYLDKRRRVVSRVRFENDVIAVVEGRKIPRARWFESQEQYDCDSAEIHVRGIIWSYSVFSTFDVESGTGVATELKFWIGFYNGDSDRNSLLPALKLYELEMVN